jgi:hypothetical protein
MFLNIEMLGFFANERGRDHMIVEFTTTCAINAYRH